MPSQTGGEHCEPQGQRQRGPDPQLAAAVLDRSSTRRGGQAADPPRARPTTASKARNVTRELRRPRRSTMLPRTAATASLRPTSARAPAVMTSCPKAVRCSPASLSRGRSSPAEVEPAPPSRTPVRYPSRPSEQKTARQAQEDRAAKARPARRPTVPASGSRFRDRRETAACRGPDRWDLDRRVEVDPAQHGWHDHDSGDHFHNAPGSVSRGIKAPTRGTATATRAMTSTPLNEMAGIGDSFGWCGVAVDEPEPGPPRGRARLGCLMRRVPLPSGPRRRCCRRSR